MNVAEAHRLFQATLETRRSAYEGANMDEAVDMDLELDKAHKAMDIAWLEEQIR